MKFATTVILTAVAAQTVLAQPHGHSHHHKKKHISTISIAKRDLVTVYVTESGEILPLEAVCAGLATNELRFKDGSDPGNICGASTPSTTAAPSPEPTSSGGGAAFYEASSTQAPSSEPTSTTQAAPIPEATSSAPLANQGYSGGQGLDAAFPDGQIDCSHFPSEYGPIPLDYLGHDGWSGIQMCSIANNMVTDIVTGIHGDGCTEGAMCSYACPPGYLKSQWPSTQGATGQSVGGLHCSGGKLMLTNPGLSTSLCIQGTGGVVAENQANGVVSICRTDYPGTEDETIPTVVQPGETQPLACPDSHTYYEWQGMATSAQYYLNPIGTGPEEACKWGPTGTKKGNWAPMNFGVSKKDGLTWLSIFQNKPTTEDTYDGTVELVGDIVGTCKYQNGQYCGATGCNKDGCTVSLASGEARYIIS